MTTADVEIESRTVDLGAATAVRADIALGVGELTVAGGAAALLEAEFRYSEPSWRPELTYRVGDDGEGRLKLRQPRESHPRRGGRERNEWDLRLNGDVPLDLRLELGVGRSDLALGGLTLTRLTVAVGVGDATIDLRGAWRQDLEIAVDGGVGKATVLLPAGVGARVEAQGGVGGVKAHGLREAEREGGSSWPRLPFPYRATYVNDTYGVAPVTLRLAVHSGVGAIVLRAGEA